MKVKPTPGKNLSIEKKYTHDHMSDGGSFKRKKRIDAEKKRLQELAGKKLKVKSPLKDEGKKS